VDSSEFGKDNHIYNALKENQNGTEAVGVRMEEVCIYSTYEEIQEQGCLLCITLLY